MFGVACGANKGLKICAYASCVNMREPHTRARPLSANVCVCVSDNRVASLSTELSGQRNSEEDNNGRQTKSFT